VGVARNMQGRVSSEKLIFTQLLKKFPAFYGTQRLVTVFTRPTISLFPKPDASSPPLLILFTEVVKLHLI